MSVYKSRRGTSPMEFIKIGQQIHVYTLEQIKKFPKSYRFTVVSDIYKLASDIHENVLRANAIYVSKNMTEMEYMMRRKFLFKVKSSIFAMSGLLTVVFDMVLKGNNFLGDKQKMSNMFQEWARLLNLEHRLIKGVIESDRKKWKSYQKSKDNQENIKNPEVENDDVISELNFLIAE